jgi:hypothetical protein
VFCAFDPTRGLAERQRDDGRSGIERGLEAGLEVRQEGRDETDTERPIRRAANQRSVLVNPLWTEAAVDAAERAEPAGFRYRRRERAARMMRHRRGDDGMVDAERGCEASAEHQ